MIDNLPSVLGRLQKALKRTHSIVKSEWEGVPCEHGVRADKTGCIPQSKLPSATAQKETSLVKPHEPLSMYEQTAAMDVFGTDDPEEMAKFTGWNEDMGEVELVSKAHLGEGTNIGVSLGGDTFDLERIFTKTSEGDLTCYNEGIHVRNQGQGLGTKIFVNQVNELIKAGFKEIKCLAAGSGKLSKVPKIGITEGANGYSTWPKLGYDASIRSIMSKTTLDLVKEKFPKARTIQDIMKTKEGRKFWEDYGTAVSNMVFDLSEGSQSRTILREYAKSKGIDFGII